MTRQDKTTQHNTTQHNTTTQYNNHAKRQPQNKTRQEGGLPEEIGVSMCTSVWAPLAGKEKLFF